MKGARTLNEKLQAVPVVVHQAAPTCSKGSKVRCTMTAPCLASRAIEDCDTECTAAPWSIEGVGAEYHEQVLKNKPNIAHLAQTKNFYVIEVLGQGSYYWRNNSTLRKIKLQEHQLNLFI